MFFISKIQTIATVFSTILDLETERWSGCRDRTTTEYMKVQTKKIIHDFWDYTKHNPAVIEV